MKQVMLSFKILYMEREGRESHERNQCNLDFRDRVREKERDEHKEIK